MTKTALILSLLLLQAMTACGQSIRVATYNLYWGNTRVDQVVDAVAAARPNVVCLQESPAGMEKALQQRLAKTHPYFHAIGYKGEHLAERLALASNVALTDLSFVPPSTGWFGFYSARLQLAGRPVHVINVHLAPLTMQRDIHWQDIMESVARMQQTHKGEVAAILETVDPNVPTIIAGDFNSLSTFAAPRMLKQHGFVDAHAAVHEQADTDATWHGSGGPLPSALRIDYIFHSRHFKAMESTIVRREGSDHSLLVAELELIE